MAPWWVRAGSVGGVSQAGWDPDGALLEAGPRPGWWVWKGVFLTLGPLLHLTNSRFIYTIWFWVFFFLWPYHVACGIFSSLTRDRTDAPCIGTAVLATGLPEEVPTLAGFPSLISTMFEIKETEERNVNVPLRNGVIVLHPESKLVSPAPSFGHSVGLLLSTHCVPGSVPVAGALAVDERKMLAFWAFFLFR